MNDTSKKIRKIYSDLMLKKTGEERLFMMVSMNNSAKRIALSTIKNEKKWRKYLFLRLYKNDFDRQTKNKIIKKLNKLQQFRELSKSQ